MKRTLVVMAVVLVLGGIAGGLTAFAHGNEGEAGAQNEATVLAVGNTYEVPLDANLTTGYIWVADYDDGLLELVDERYEVGSELMGGSGQQVFVFRALTVGRAQVNFSYLRPCENEAIETDIHTFDILPSLDDGARFPSTAE